jgi:hypothetical protein
MNSVVAKRIRFADAVRLVGADDSELLKVLDYLLGATLVAAAPGTGGATLGWLEVKSDVMRLLGELRLKIVPTLRHTAGRRRAELLAAAHAVLVVSAYFEAVDSTGLLGSVTLRRDDELRIASAIRADAGGTDLVGGLLVADLPTPGPQRPYDVLTEDLREHFGLMSERLLRFLTGLAFWDELGLTDRELIRRRLLTDVPADALKRYEQNLGQFAVACPEFVFWTNLWEHVATREALRRALPTAVFEQLDVVHMVLRDMQGGLDGLTHLLRGLPGGDGALPRWQELAKVYDDDIRRPITDADDHDGPDDLDMPSLAESYVNPAIRVAEIGRGVVRSAEDSWWRTYGKPVDIQSFLAGYLTSPVASERPLLVLGSPGSGKSALTRVLAARLGSTGHQPLRVDLSRVPAGAPIVEQIEASLRTVLARTVHWAELADAARDQVPVIILDGLDELLQSIPAGRWDYLTHVVEFQRTQAAQGRPVAVVVTSRTVVANRVHIPTGTTVIALEPFDESRINAWTRRWNEHHAQYFAAHGLRSLPHDTVMRHVQLAEQPLLLVLLALYDLADNALQHHSGELAHGALYEQLLTSFVAREVRKSGSHRDDESIVARIEDELYRLAIAAYAMFNRACPYITHDVLSRDLAALSGTSDDTGDAAATLVGHFYFVHVSRAVPDRSGARRGAEPAELRTYEFLHPTFAEYLVARLAVDALLGLPSYGPGRRLARNEPDDELLRTLLSWQPLTTETQIVAFLLQLAQRADVAGPAVREALLSIANGCLRRPEPPRLHAYEPTARDLPGRYATYSLNLVVLLVTTSGGRMPLSELVVDGNPGEQWRRLVLLWQSSIEGDTWNSLRDELTVEGDIVLLRRATGDMRAWPRRAGNSVAELYRTNGLLQDPALARLLDTARPLAQISDMLFQPAASLGVSAAEALIALVCADAGTAAARYADCVRACADLPTEQRIGYLSLVVRQLSGGSGETIDPETVLEVTGAAAELAAVASDVPLCADLVDCVAVHLGRDAVLDAALTTLLADLAAHLASPSLATVEPVQRLRVAVLLAEQGVPRPDPDPSPFALASTLAEVDLAVVARSDAWLVTRTLRAARLARLPHLAGPAGRALLSALPAATRDRLSIEERNAIAQSESEGSHLAS